MAKKEKLFLFLLLIGLALWEKQNVLAPCVLAVSAGVVNVFWNIFILS
jgi:hypothetical protein